MRTPPKRQLGAGLPIALFIITVLALLVATMSQIQETTGELRSMQIQETRAFYAAETGAQAAVHALIGPGASATCSTPVYDETFSSSGPGLAGCSASVSCAAQTVGSDTYYTLESVGVCGNGPDRAQRTIEVRVQ